MPLPNIQQAQYGDRVSLDKLGATRRTNNPAADVNGMKNMAGGRPPETDPVKLAMRSMGKAQPQAQPAPQEAQFQQQFGDLAVQYQTALKWQKIAAQPGAGPYTRWYAQQAIRDFARNFYSIRRATPFFDEA